MRHSAKEIRQQKEREGGGGNVGQNLKQRGGGGVGKQ